MGSSVFFREKARETSLQMILQYRVNKRRAPHLTFLSAVLVPVFAPSSSMRPTFPTTSTPLVSDTADIDPRDTGPDFISVAGAGSSGLSDADSVI